MTQRRSVSCLPWLLFCSDLALTCDTHKHFLALQGKGMPALEAEPQECVGDREGVIYCPSKEIVLIRYRKWFGRVFF